MLILIRQKLAKSLFAPALITWMIGSLLAQTVVAGQILVDKGTEGVKPLVLAAPNGVPVVNIATPGSNGVSNNQYTQFDVNNAGVILNNSKNNVNTQLSGYIAGNNQLGRKPARIILNQVNGTNPSQLNGYLEVAGQQAQVIIANQNGITCDGCGFINTTVATLTSGKVNTNGDGISNTLVQQGQVGIVGSGLDASTVSELNIQGRHITIDAPIYAQALNIIAGTNQISADNQAALQTDNIPTTGSVSIDTKALGGLYANKIKLVSTEAGLGVNVVGTVIAQQGQFTINSQGQLGVSGHVQADQDISISAHEGVAQEFGSKIQSQQDVSIASQQAITLAGELTSQGLTLVNSQSLAINNQADISSQGNVTLTIDQLAALNGTVASQASILATANDMAMGGNWSAMEDLTLTATNTLTAGQHQWLAGQDVTLKADDISLQDGHLESGKVLQLQADTRTDLINQTLLGPSVIMQGSAGGRTATTDITDSYVGETDESGQIAIKAGQLTLKQAKQANSEGAEVYTLVSNGAISLQTESVVDQGIRAYSHADINLQTDDSLNATGDWVAGSDSHTASITVTSGKQVNLTDATLAASDDVTITAQQGISTSNSRLQATGQLSITSNGVTAAAPTNLDTSTLVAKDIAISSDHLKAGNTQVYASNNINLGSTNLQDVGQWVAGNDLNVTLTDDITINSDEYLAATKLLNLQANTHNINNAGTLQGNTIELSASTLTNTGEIAATDLNATHQTQADRSQSQPIHTLVHQGKLFITDLDIALNTFTNTGGTVRGDSITIDASNQLQHQNTGTIFASGQVNLSGGDLTLASTVSSDTGIDVKIS